MAIPAGAWTGTRFSNGAARAGAARGDTGGGPVPTLDSRMGCTHRGYTWRAYCRRERAGLLLACVATCHVGGVATVQVHMEGVVGGRCTAM